MRLPRKKRADREPCAQGRILKKIHSEVTRGAIRDDIGGKPSQERIFPKRGNG